MRLSLKTPNVHTRYPPIASDDPKVKEKYEVKDVDFKDDA